MSETPDAASPDRVECPAAKDPAVRLFIVAAMLLGFGLYCFYDAYIAKAYPYPADGNLNDMFKHYFNHAGGIVFPLGGLVPLAWGIVFLRRRLVATADGIGYVGKDPVAWGQVTRLDASRLQDKGILKLHVGAAKPLVLDEWKLDNFKALVAFVEEHVPADVIEEPDGPPEIESKNQE